MQIDTTIRITKDGYCLLEQDVAVEIDYDTHDGDYLTWKVEKYLISGIKHAWDKEACNRVPQWKAVEAPPALAAAFAEGLNKAGIEEELVERLLRWGQLRTSSPAQHHRDAF